MPALLRCFIFFFLYGTATVVTANAASPLPQMLQHSVACVVNIKVYGDAATEDAKKPQHFVAIGSGIVTDAQQGYIVTNAHILKEMDKVIVTLPDGQQRRANIVGIDKESDIAVLKIKAPHLSALTFADINTLAVGDTVYAIGNPFGLGTSVSSGIVSALERNNLNLEHYEDFIQIDAPINPGNSGGALINTRGELVGMNTAILSTAEEGGGNIGIGFAIPVSMLEAVIPQLIKNGKVKRGLLGIMVQTMTPVLADALNSPEQQGAVVTSVSDLSPAQAAGIKVGDVITAVNAVPVKTASQIVNTVGFLPEGTEVKLTVFRHAKPRIITLTILDKHQQALRIQKKTPYLSDVSFQEVHFYSSEDGQMIGVLLAEVPPDSTAWVSGLRPGDIIVSANGESTPSIEALQNRISTLQNSMALLIVRHHTSEFITLIPEEA